MKLSIRLGLGGPLLLVAACAAGRAGSPDPSSAAVEKPRFEAVVVGTIHKFHLLQPDYPLSRLGELIEGYQPDLVLVEIRPSAFREGHFEDGPFEMTYVTWIARNRGVPVEPIDWFREDNVGPPTFDEIHSAERDTAFLSMLNLRARYLGGDGTWNQRQAWFHHQAAQAIRRHGAHRVMAFVGAFHRPELERFLSTQGGSVRSPRTIVTGSGGGRPSQVPQPVIQLWREGVERMRKRAAEASGKLSDALRSKVRYFEVAIERGGSCCAEPAVFEERKTSN